MIATKLVTLKLAAFVQQTGLRSLLMLLNIYGFKKTENIVGELKTKIVWLMTLKRLICVINLFLKFFFFF
jgi:hypothetical protein